ncbi:MAG TPA: PAS domain S-box protein [Candidatus Acidoferrales bacterium]|nr:PAS domain S-box protein [Candidatus Acidoferrales bacterium]
MDRHEELEAQLAQERLVRKRLEDALRHSEARFRLIAKGLTEMVMAYDMDRRLTFVNAAAQSLTGYTIGELESAHFICWVHPDDRERMLAKWEPLFEGGSFHEEEYRLVTRDGRIKWVSASWGPIYDDGGRQVGVQGHEHEVTERHMSEEALRMREERYRSLFEDSPFPMWEEDCSGVKRFIDELAARGVSDPRAHLMANRSELEECVRRVRILDVNRAALRFYGATRKDQLLGDLNRLFDERSYELFCDELGVLVRQPIYKAEFETPILNGEERTVSMIVSVEGSPKDWSRVVVTFFDITDRKRLEEQILQSQKLESLGRLAGGIAHDFNNLLMVISGYSDLLLNNLANSETLRRGLNEIRRAGERGAELTQQLLAFSRKQATQPRALDLNALIRDSQGMLQRLIGEDIELEFKLHPDPWTIKADRGQMHQVLMNLVVNGRHAMPDGGVLTIETTNIRLEDPPGEHLCLRIRDTGVGMDDETRRHAFEPFFTTKGAGKGTGLGLATVFGIVTQAGGQISVTSEPGRGTTFHLHFPRLAGAAPAEPAAAAERTAKHEGGTLLVVEDQEEVRGLACTILRERGFDVLEAADGDEALTVARRFPGPIRLMLTDIIMPGMNGKELAARLAPLRPDTRVIYMSGYTDRVNLDDNARLLEKPFTAERLIGMVREVLKGTG